MATTTDAPKVCKWCGSELRESGPCLYSLRPPTLWVYDIWCGPCGTGRRSVSRDSDTLAQQAREDWRKQEGLRDKE
jgi:hypothetical protein